MARIGVSITKSTSFRGSTQEFSNVYYYNCSALPDATQADAVIDALATLEKTWHATTVTFVRGRLWSETGSASGNNMISQKNLTGTGSRTTVAGMDKERAFLFRIRAGTDTRGQPVYLRKWYHACGQFFSAQSVSSGILDNTSSIPSADKTTMNTAVQAVELLTVNGINYVIVAKSGRLPSSSEHFTSHNFLEHHQLGDMWRAQ